MFPAEAQPLAQAERQRQATSPLLSAASQAKDLEFPAEAYGISLFTTPRMALYKPEGAGPFPALVLHHQCGGLGDGGKPNASMLDWAKEAIGRFRELLLADYNLPISQSHSTESLHDVAKHRNSYRKCALA